MKEKEYILKEDRITLFRCKDMKEIEKDIENIFKENKKILPKNKNAKILIKPNFNNDLNALTGNSTDLRIIVSVLKSLKKRNYKNIIIADGPNCGINHIGINVFSRLCIDKIAKKFNVKLLNLNKDEGKTIKLVTGKAEIAKTVLNSDFIINLPKLKTHVEAGITISCKNHMGCLKGVEKRKAHDNLSENIIRLNEIIKSNLIIVDGLIGMEGRGPGDGIPKKVGVILSGHNPFLVDFLCSKLMGLNYKEIPFLKIAIKKRYISKENLLSIKKIEPITKFKSAKKTIFDKILLNNFFIGIRFSKPFHKFFNKGLIPWILFKLKVKQDKYVFEDRKIKRLFEKKNLTEEEKNKVKGYLKVYCPLGPNTLDKKDCIKCMYCYQIAPHLIDFEGSLGDFEMQIKRFGKYLKQFRDG